MKSFLALLAELEAPMRRNLAAYVQRELAREYQPKHRTQAQKLPASALTTLSVEGERIKAQVLDAGHSHRVDMTFPLFDLDTDFTLIQCSCLRDRVSLEALRCSHMYFVQLRIQTMLDELEQAEEVPASSPLDQWEQLCPETQDAASWLDERRLVLWVNPESWELRCEWQTRPRYERTEVWHPGERQTLALWKTALLKDRASDCEHWRQALARAQGLPEREVFELLSVAAQRGDTPVYAGDELRLQLTATTWQIQLESSDEGYWLRLGLGPSSLRVRRFILGSGLVSWDLSAAELLLSAVDDAAVLSLLEPLCQQRQAIPLAERDRMLRFLQRLDPGLVHLVTPSGPEPAPEAARAEPVLRLTPFQRGGMKIELMVCLGPKLVLRAGEGAEQVSDLGSRPRRLLIRDFGEERRLVRSLVHELELAALPEPEPEVFIAYNDRCALDLMQRVEAAAQKFPFVVEWPEHLRNLVKPYTLINPDVQASLQVSLGERRDWFELDGWMQLDDGTKLGLKELLEALRNEKRYLQLPDGRWVLISEHFRRRLEPLVVASEADEEGCTFDLAALGNESLLAQIEEFPFQAASKSFWQMVLQARRSYQVDESLPQGLQVQLRPYQLDGFRWMNRLYESGLGACLADDMGLGKTLQTLTLLLKKASQGPSLVVAPSSLAFNWASEARRFCPELRMVMWREDRGTVFAAGDVVIVSYGLVLRHAEILAQAPWNIVVLDEAQQVKNALTKTARAVQQLRARWMLALSGTPIENRLSELWSLFRTLAPGLFGEWERFRRAYVFPIERERSERARERLKQKLAPFVLRRMKRDYLTELPEKTEIDQWIDLSDEERTFYDALRGEAIASLQKLTQEQGEDQAKQRIQMLAALSRLRQAACHRQLVDAGWEGEASKLDFLKERLLELRQAGHAALVFSQFTRFLRLIAETLEHEGLRVMYLDGSTPLVERQRLVEAFQQGEGDVFLISLKAGGTGLNLTRASYVFHMDPWWNPAVEAQATDRAYRMGQKQAVTVYKLRARQTIEELIHQIHGEKRELMETLLEGREPGRAWIWDELWNLLLTPGQRSPAGARVQQNPRTFGAVEASRDPFSAAQAPGSADLRRQAGAEES